MQEDQNWLQVFVAWLFLFSSVQVSLVYGQMNEPPGARARVALTGLTVAEYFRDVQGQDVLLFIDNIFRFTQAGSEVGFCLILILFFSHVHIWSRFVSYVLG